MNHFSPWSTKGIRCIKVGYSVKELPLHARMVYRNIYGSTERIDLWEGQDYSDKSPLVKDLSKQTVKGIFDDKMHQRILSQGFSIEQALQYALNSLCMIIGMHHNIYNGSPELLICKAILNHRIDKVDWKALNKGAQQL